MNKHNAYDLAFDAVNKMIQPKQLLSADCECLCKQLEPIIEAYKILKGEKNKRASEGDVVQALNGMSMMALGVKANEYFIPVNTIKQKSAWSEEDEKMFIELHNLIYVVRDHDCDSTRKKELSYWLESLKNRVQPKQEWSEEDENIRRWIISDIKKLSALGKKSPFIANKEYDWLNSLRPQNRWKPTKQQLTELRHAISGCSFETSILVELEENLKKLL